MKRQITRTLVVGLSLVMLAQLTTPVRAALWEDHFTNAVGNGIWDSDFNWTTTSYANNGHTRPDSNGDPISGPDPTYNAVLDSAAPCSLGISVTIQGLTVATGSTLNVANNVILTAKTPFTNNGVVNLNSTDGVSHIKAANGSGVGATGKIFMTDRATNYISAVAHGNTFTISPGGLISGAGQLNPGYFGDTEHLLNYVNQGTIAATQPNNLLQIGMGGQVGVNANLTNTGTLLASGTGTLRIHAFNTSGTVFNSGGTITAIGSGIVRIVSPAVVEGGTLVTSDNGTIRGEGAGGTLKDLTNAGSIVVAENETLGLAGNIENNGTISLVAPAGGGGAYLVFHDNTTLSGNGTLTMSDSDHNGFYAPSTGFDLTIDPDATIEGSGSLWSYQGGNQLPLYLTNHGLINANHPAHSLLVYLTDLTPIMENTGILRASNGATLALLSNSAVTTLNNGGGGLIETLDKSTVTVGGGVTIEGGTVSTSGTGVVRGSGGGFSNVTNTGTMVASNSATFYLANTFTNNGTLQVDGGFGVIDGDITLAGSGTLLMSGGGFYSANGNGNTMTIGSEVAIEGWGTLGVYLGGNQQPLNYVNMGLIHANDPANVLNIFSSGGLPTFPNTGILRASDGASLQLIGNGDPVTLVNYGGTIEALAGSAINTQGNVYLRQDSGTINLDGTLTVPNGLDLNGGQLTGNGTFVGAIRNNGGSLGPGHSPGKMVVTGDYTQGASGTLELEIGGTSPTEYDQVEVSGTAALDGTLNVTLINGFRPAIGDVFQIILPRAFSGTFATINTIGFTGQVNYSAGAITLTVATVPDVPLNISTRLQVLTGDNVLIGGFIITGSEPKKVIIRGIGPSLIAAGVSGALADPIIELHKPDGTVTTNDNWRTDQEAEIIATTIPPTNDLESAIVATLDPGAYTAVVGGKDGATGVGLVEVYDLGLAAKSKLANLSTRGFVDTQDNVMIGGFIMGGNGRANGRAVIRAIGPSLVPFGIANALKDPVLELHDANGATLMVNDDWQTSQKAEIEATGLAPTDSRESAMVVLLPDGGYTAIVHGQNDTTGVALIESYSVL